MAQGADRQFQSASSFDELGFILEDLGLLDVLDLPLSEVGLPPKVRLELYRGFGLSQDDPLGALLDAADEMLAARSERWLRRKLFSALKSWLERQVTPPPRAGARPNDERSLDAWAKDRGILPELDQPAAIGVEPGSPAYYDSWRYPLDHWTIRDLLLGRGQLGFSSRDETPLFTAAWTYLDRAAAVVERGISEERRLGLDQVPSIQSEPAAQIGRALAAYRAQLRALVGPRPADAAPPAKYTLQASNPPAIGLSENPSGRARRNVDTRLFIGIHPGESIRHSCTCPSDACVHALRAVDFALNMVANEAAADDAMRTKLLDAITQQPWQRALAAIARVASVRADRAEDALLWWCIDDGDFGVRIRPYLQRRGKRGHYLKPKRASVGSVDQAHFANSTDRQVHGLLGAMRSSGGHRDLEFDPIVGAALELLVGHPRVCLDDSLGEACEVTIAPLSVAVVEAPDGLRFRASAGDLTFDRREFHRVLDEHVVDDFIVLLDPPARRVRLVRLTQEAVDLISTVHDFDVPIPEAGHSAIVRALPQLEVFGPVELPASIGGRQVPCRDEVVLVLTSSVECPLAADVRVRPIADAALLNPGDGPRRVVADTPDRELVFALRALDSEPSLASDRVARVLPGRTIDEHWRLTVDDIDDALDAIAALRGSDAVTCLWPDGGIEVVGRATPDRLAVAVRDRGDWFGLEGGLEVDGHRVSIALLLVAAREGRRYVKVDDKRFVALESSLAKRLQNVERGTYDGKHGVELTPGGIAALDELAGDVATFDASERWSNLVARIQDASDLQPDVPASLQADLRPYQVDGYRWLARLAAWGAGAILADDMGLGKTLQALALLLARAGDGPALVMAPTSVTFNWMREAAKFAPSLRMISYRGSDRAGRLEGLAPGDVLVVSYALALRDAEAIAAVHWSTLVADEAQAFKNAATKRARAIARFEADVRLALTGTPMENHLGELWAIFRVVFPGLLGSWERFRDKYAKPIERDRDRDRAKDLSALIRPFVLRRKKSEVAADLPSRTDVRVDVTLSSKERDLYDDVRLAAVAELEGLELDAARPQARFTVLAAMTRLRQLACHPKLRDGASTVPSSKLARLLDLLRELHEEGQQTLVFSQFTKHLGLVRDALEAIGLSYLYLDGATPAASRGEIVDRFQGGEAAVFLISLKAGGTGLNLTAAENVVHLDPWWNPAVEDQATDRAHRIGQTKPVTVYRLVTLGTIEEAILGLHAQKRALVSDVLEGTDHAQSLSTAELAALITQGGTSTLDADETSPSARPAAAGVGTTKSVEDAERPAVGAAGSNGARAPVRSEAGKQAFDSVVRGALEALGGAGVAATEIRARTGGTAAQVRAALERLERVDAVARSGRTRGVRYSLRG